ncbi:NFACT RNA binding domain-containing protein [Lacticigenium naphthae]|uniref:NFACT RNA binding domain-containing protein n=1 Tax=Lacticigenium naphthae TaxID=515351 RepID=UPI0004264FC5|nr:NFACT RNA binding domain-containing protein [Lacticigenium naphthae]
MSFDGIFTHAMVDEIKDALIEGRISKIHQPYPNEIILIVRSQRKNYRLLLSAHPQYARMQVTTIEYENPSAPPQFCMIMRKYLEGAILDSIEQEGNDRVVKFSFKKRNEIGDVQSLLLVVEIMGRHSNVLLINQEGNKIIDALRHVSPSQNSFRTLLPGAEYREAPKQEKINPFEDPSLKNLDSVPKDAREIQEKFQGVGKDTANEIIHRMQTTGKDFYTALNELIIPIQNKEISPTLITSGKKEYFVPLRFDSIEGTLSSFSTLSELLDAYYEEKAEKDRVGQQATDLINRLSTEKKKNEKKLKKLEQEFNDTKKAKQFQVKGEVLTAYLHEVEKGQEHISLPNFYEENEQIEIALNPRLTPAQNAQKFFTKYQKLKNATIHLTKQIAETKQEINYLDSILTQLEVASPRDIEDIREEIIEEGYLKRKNKKKMKKKKRNNPDKFISSDGSEILVGKNNHQNDELTMKIARKTDVWLHTKDIPGSHVIIRDDDPSEQTILEAAQIAAYYSKARSSSSVPVDKVQVKQIRKPNGAKPGFVIYEGQTTLFVTPSIDVIHSLHAKE